MAVSFRLKSVIAAGIVAFAAFQGPQVAAQEKVLKVIPHSNLAILDPIWTTQYMVRNHGYMIYDTLFGTDAKSQIKPQMVDSWTVSDDNRLWTFKLRKGLVFHDGAPVTGEDVIASLSRWGKRDAMGQKLFTFVERLDSPAPDTFRIFLREACGFVLEALGKPSSNVPFIMPKRVAETPADKQIDDYTGSGPYVFVRDQYKPGDKAVYAKFDKYVPRNEPPSGTAGGKKVYVDRVEWNLALRDAQQQVNALIRGEVDMIEQPAFESYAALRADPNVEIVDNNPLGFQYMLRFNHLHKPFDNPKVKAAAIMALNQEAFLKAQVGDPKLYKVCASMFTCGTPYASNAGAEAQNLGKGNLKKAQEMLKASGYDGTPIVVMKPTDLASITKLPDVAAQLLRLAGFKVDLQSMDWNTLVSRRAKKDPPAQGGWNIFATAWVAPDIWNPLTNAAIGAGGDKAWFGWANSPEIEKLRDQFARETDDAKKKSLAQQIQKAAFEYGTHAPLGEYVQPAAVRKGVKGVVSGPGNFYWNIQK
ncbi:ABC transporter substrate-binding protein [Burkholderiaceae bacterium FT117]|uniref:ABC transporter substrate-binding protein n=1 Tax=Zeimonas sediminis TaxID=2944268 RepID=UPI0023431F9A|nr:ABC transporter substrate-binding protein [Zeimonas sediminis]MCM5568936.1 ABC transporter substrate-binding protein [Zeimonas sediminis]